MRRALDAGIDVVEVEDDALSSVLDLRSSRGVVAVARQRLAEPSALVSDSVRAARPLLVLVELADPGNVGTLLRVAEGAGCVGALLSTNSADVFNPKTVRASAGSLFRLPVATELDPSDVFDLLAVRSPRRGGDPAPGRPPARGGIARRLRSRSCSAARHTGCPTEVLGRCARSVTLPLDGEVESLNAAVAGAAVLLDASRQRRAVAGAAPGTGSGVGPRLGHDDGSKHPRHRRDRGAMTDQHPGGDPVDRAAAIESEALAAIAAAGALDALADVESLHLNKRSALSSLKAAMRDVDPARRSEVGAAINRTRAAIESAASSTSS